MASWLLLSLSSLSLLLASCRAANVPSFNDALTAHPNLTSFQSLLSGQFPDLLKQLNDADASNPVTVVAPSNGAFDNMAYSSVVNAIFTANDSATIGNLLKYHIIPGMQVTSQTLDGSFDFLPTLLTDESLTSVSGGQRVGVVLQGGEPELVVFVSGMSTRSVVLKEDIAFTGGIIQMVDNFLVPPQPFVDTCEAFDLADPPQSITSFLGAVYSLPNMDVANYLNASHNITVFVPNNIAMEMVNGALASLSPANLTNLLAYHIFTSSEPLYSSNFTNGTVLSSTTGNNLHFTFEYNALFVNSARVLTSDLLINNGVMHVIDNVLNPNITTGVPNPTSVTQIPVLPTTMGEFNSSSAPYTTFQPSVVAAAEATAATAISSGEAGYTGPSSTSTSAFATSTKKSGAVARYGGMMGYEAPALAAGVFGGALFAL